jgi:membrane associated rhomboid family serine protease
MDPAMIPGGWVAVFTSPITHMLVHGDITHLLVNAAWLLAFGTAIARRMSAGRFLALCALCGVAGALAFLVLNWGSTASVIGISGAVSGLMGGAFRFFFSAVDRGAVALLRFEPRLVPRMGLRQALADRRIQFAIGLWLIANLLIAWGAAGLTQQAGIAWEAHVGGFLAGFLLFGLFDQGADPGEDEQLVS